jgi:hypothetical protein
MTEFWNLIQIGSVYLTSNEASNGGKLICTIEGMDVFGIGYDGSQDRSLSNVVYTQLQATNESAVDIKIPLLHYDLYDAIRDVITAWIATPTDFTFNVTGIPDNFTGTAKPRWEPKPLEYSGERVGDYLRDATLRLWVKD